MKSLIQTIRATDFSPIVYLGEHPGLIQAQLDFEYICNLPRTQLVGIVASTSGYSKYFWGEKEILVSRYATVAEFLRTNLKPQWFVNVLSARRYMQPIIELSQNTSTLVGGVIFAENITEQNAQATIEFASNHKLHIFGPSSVGFCVPGNLKLGPIGGVDPQQLETQHITQKGGEIAIISASGGMTGELINIVSQTTHGISFAASYGGDRFPILSPQEIFLLAQDDPQTKIIAYYGELGGVDEYVIIDLVKSGRITKPIVAHIAGTVADTFVSSPQFGHAKAKAAVDAERAAAKRAALKDAGVRVSQNFAEFIKIIKSI